MSAAAEEAALAVVGEVLASHSGRRLFPIAGCQVCTALPLQQQTVREKSRVQTAPVVVTVKVMSLPYIPALLPASAAQGQHRLPPAASGAGSLCMPDAQVVGCRAGRAGVTAGSRWLAGGGRPAAADAAHSAAESSSMPRSVEPGPRHADGGPGRPASPPGYGRCTDGPAAARAGRRGGAATRRGAARAPGAAGGRGGASTHHGWRAQVVLICLALL